MGTMPQPCDRRAGAVREPNGHLTSFRSKMTSLNLTVASRSPHGHRTAAVRYSYDVSTGYGLTIFIFVYIVLFYCCLLRPGKQFFSHVETEPPIPGYYQYFWGVNVSLLKETTHRPGWGSNSGLPIRSPTL